MDYPIYGVKGFTDFLSEKPATSLCRTLAEANQQVIDHFKDWNKNQLRFGDRKNFRREDDYIKIYKIHSKKEIKLITLI